MRVLISLLVICLPSLIMATDEHLKVAQSNKQFTLDWYNVLAEKPGNVFFSPISAHAVLSMVWQGAQGTTNEAFAKTFYLSENKITATGYNSIMSNLNNVQNITLSIANKVYIQQGTTLLPEFNNAIVKNFASGVQQLNFANNVESAQIINKWVEQQTHDKIKDIIKKGDLDENTGLVLVNAIYFKGNWKYQFDKNETFKNPFYLNDKDNVEVDMMYIVENFHYKNDNELEAQILELPYLNEEFSMVIILPTARNGIKALEEKLKNVDLNKITEGLNETEVIVTLPKFKFETTIDMEESLTKLGLGEIFDEGKANFTGIVPNGNLAVGKAIQKAFIEVNEEGAEAAAATAVVMSFYSDIVGEEHIYFTADHPFIFMIKGPEHPLFFGKLEKV